MFFALNVTKASVSSKVTIEYKNKGASRINELICFHNSFEDLLSFCLFFAPVSWDFASFHGVIIPKLLLKSAQYCNMDV